MCPTRSTDVEHGETTNVHDDGPTASVWSPSIAAGSRVFGDCRAGYVVVHSHEHVFSFFFFQAEDGIRDVAVTGVQTCALPILLPRAASRARSKLSMMGMRSRSSDSVA